MKKTSHQDRVEMVEQHLAGKSLPAIAEQRGLNVYTVRSWWRAYRDRGWDALLSQREVGRPRTGSLSTFDPLVRYVALRLKAKHPQWGPDVLLYRMGQRASLSGKRLPSRSALAAYLQPYLPRLHKKRQAVVQRPRSPKVRAQVVHEVWQMDFKGKEEVGECVLAAPLMVVDVLSSAPLHTLVFEGQLKGVTWRTVQDELRTAFTEWGLPDFIQMDRDPVFVGSTRLEWPGGLLLWLVGLGVNPVVNDAHRPTQNAQVERQNRTWQEHVAVGPNYATLQAVQQATDRARKERLYHLPSRNAACGGQPPMVACPQLAHPRRSFDRTCEPDLFDFENVALYLSDWRWRRTVDKVGYISLADQNVYVDRHCHQQTVEVTYDLTENLFVARTLDDARATLCTFTLSVITPQHILGLDDAGGCH